jgi:hypothetical protein
MPTYTCNNDAARGNPGYCNSLTYMSYVSESAVRNSTTYSSYGNNYNQAEANPLTYYYPPSHTNKVDYPEYWYSSNWYSRFDTSAIPSQENISSVTLNQYARVSDISGLDYNTANIEVHGLNWTYSASGGSGYPGVTLNSSNWYPYTSFNNKLFTISASVMSNSVSLKNFSGTNNAKTWVNKGGWTYTVGTDSRYITGGFFDTGGGGTPQARILLTDAIASNSNLTVVTTAAPAKTYNLIVSPR